MLVSVGRWAAAKLARIRVALAVCAFIAAVVWINDRIETGKVSLPMLPEQYEQGIVVLPGSRHFSDAIVAPQSDTQQLAQRSAAARRPKPVDQQRLETDEHDETCQSANGLGFVDERARALHLHHRRPPLLLSFPGSGNTWCE